MSALTLGTFITFVLDSTIPPKAYNLLEIKKYLQALCESTGILLKGNFCWQGFLDLLFEKQHQKNL